MKNILFLLQSREFGTFVLNINDLNKENIANLNKLNESKKNELMNNVNLKKRKNFMNS